MGARADAPAVNHSGDGESLYDDPEVARILDVARAAFIEHGIRKTSVSMIAELAGISRRTIHRRFGEKDDIVSLVAERDIREFFSRVAKSAIALNAPADAMVEAFVLGIRECRTHQLVIAILQAEHDTMSNSAFSRHDTTGRIREAVALLLTMNNHVPAAAAQEIADLLIRITTTLLLAPSPVLPTTTDHEARSFAVKYLAPLVAAGLAGRSLTTPG